MLSSRGCNIMHPVGLDQRVSLGFKILDTSSQHAVLITTVEDQVTC